MRVWKEFENPLRLHILVFPVFPWRMKMRQLPLGCVDMVCGLEQIRSWHYSCGYYRFSCVCMLPVSISASPTRRCCFFIFRGQSLPGATRSGLLSTGLLLVLRVAGK